MKLRNRFLVTALFVSGLVASAQDWKMGKATLMTPFAEKVDTANVLGEYPRPQMVREKWMSLNGIWQFQPGVSFTQVPPAGKFSQKILVPFPVESALSGIMKHSDNLLYRRKFIIPSDWAGQRVLVHFGAVDYKSQIYINGINVGTHTGGYDPFTFDITVFLKPSGQEQEITVKVYDPTDKAGIPRGKQSLTPGGIMYTACSGIWQSVWLEPVPQTSVSEIKIVPDLDKSSVVIKTTTTLDTVKYTVDIEVNDGKNTVARFSGDANADLRIPIRNPRLWSPDSPFLYDLKIKLMKGNTVIDSLGSYFGMRKISMKKVGNVQKLMLNNEFLFQFGPLDQGYWPDGVYTAPTDSAMLFDLQKTKEFGYNMIRKHIKVEPYRWYYYADKLGLLVWQDMPSINSYTSSPQPIDKAAFKSELERMVKTHWNSPSIIMWVIFNEELAQHDTEALVANVMSLDSTRMVNENSGVVHKDVGHILDIHSYPQPACPASTTKVLACGEYGSVGLSVPGHVWGTGVSFILTKDGNELLEIYKSYAEKLIRFKSDNGLSAAVFTQNVDVEVEVNGIYTYDRAVCKVDKDSLLKINSDVIHKNLIINYVLPSSRDNGRVWKYTTSQPGSTWYASAYNDTYWPSGTGGFGQVGTAGAVNRTIWSASDIWMRQKFEVGNLSAAEISKLEFYVHHDEDCEIYINGVLAGKFSGYTSDYMLLPITDAAKNALIPNGTNTIAIHCHQTGGGQYIDAGLLIRSYETPVPSAVNTPVADSGFHVYPNPTTGKLMLINRDQHASPVGVYDNLGCMVLRLKRNVDSVDVSSLKNGLYFLQVKTDSGYKCLPFIRN